MLLGNLLVWLIKIVFIIIDLIIALFFSFLVHEEGKVQKRKQKTYETTIFFLGMQASNMSLKRILWRSTGGVSKVKTSK
jgi:hypothetical protein